VPKPAADETIPRGRSAISYVEASDTPDLDLETQRIYARDRISLLQQLEIDRILSAFRLNPYDVLEVPIEADDKTITKIYRKKSLLIHPDKVKHGKSLIFLVSFAPLYQNVKLT
jgi:DnaJ family protein C protein 8